MDNYCSFSKIGSAHIADHKDNQDAVFYEDNKDGVLLAVLADGVSSCKNSRCGAQFVCGLIRDIMFRETDFIMSLSGASAAGLLIGCIREEIKKLAAEEGEDPFSYASTLSFVCIDRAGGRVLVFSLGDSRIYAVTNEGEISALNAGFEIDGCATMTVGADKKAYAEVIPIGRYESFLLCTDGAWRLMNDGGKMDHDIRRYMIEADVIRIRDYFRSADNRDDCSYCFIGPEQIEEW